MNKADKAILTQVKAIREALVFGGDVSAANTLDSAYRQYKTRQITVRQYGQTAAEIMQRSAAYLAELDAQRADSADLDTTLANTAFARKVAPSQREGLQTVRTGTRIDVTADIAGNTVETETALFKTVKPKAQRVSKGAEAKKARRIERQRLAKAEAQRAAQRAERAAQRQHIETEAAQRAERAEAERAAQRRSMTAAERAEADNNYFAAQDRTAQRPYYGKGFQTRTLEVQGVEGSAAAFTEADYTPAQRQRAEAERAAAAQRVAAKAEAQRAARKG